MRELLQQSKWSVMWIISGVTVGFIISVFTARSLGAKGKGSYTLALLVISTVGLFVNPGIYAAANYFLSSRKLSKRNVFQTSVSLCLPFALLAFIVALAIFLLLIKFRQQVIDPTSFWLALLVGIGALATAFGSTMIGILLGAKQVKAIALIAIASAIFQILSAVFYMLTSKNYTVLFFVALFVGAQLFESIARLAVAGHGSWRGFSLQTHNYRRFLRYGSPVHLGRILLVGSQKIDAYLVFLLAGQAALGIYSISSTVAEQLWLLPTAISMVMMANIAYRPTKEAIEITSAASQYVTLLALIAASVLAVVGSWLMPLVFGSEFSASIVPFLIMLLGMVAVCIYPILEPFFQSQLKPWIPIRITIISAIANALLCILLIPRYGVIGAALAYTLSYWAQTILTSLAFRHFTQKSYFEPVNIFRPLGVMISLIETRLVLKLGHIAAANKE